MRVDLLCDKYSSCGKNVFEKKIDQMHGVNSAKVDDETPVANTTLRYIVYTK